jgi:tetratricopeptide (TPR) repeat protein
MPSSAIVFWALCLGLLWVLGVRDWWHQRTFRRKAELFAQSWGTGQALLREKKWAEAAAALEKALACAESQPDLQAEVRFHLGYALEHVQQPEQAISAYRASWLAESAQQPPKYRHLAAFRQGCLLTELQRWEEAELALRTSIREADRVPLPGLRLNALRVLLRVYRGMSRHDRFLECAEEAERLAHVTGDEPAEALFLDMIGDVHLALGKPAEALCDYEQSLDLFRRVGNAEAELMVKRDIGQLYQQSGDWDKAFRWLDACLREEERAQNWIAQGRICYDIACLHIHSGELERAADYLQRSVGFFRQGEDRAGVDHVGRTLVGLGILRYRKAMANRLTFGEIERGSAGSKGQTEE